MTDVVVPIPSPKAPMPRRDDPATDSTAAPAPETAPPADPSPGTSGADGRAAPDPATPVKRHPYTTIGRYAWATLGIVGVLYVTSFGVAALSVVIIPVILALFPAALLSPVTRWLKAHKVPAALASILTILGLMVALVGIFAGITFFALDQLPDLQESLGEGIDDVEQTIEDDPLGLGYDFPGFGALLDDAQDAVMGGEDEDGGENGVAGGATGAASAAVELVTSLLLMFVVLFFYLKDEGRLSDGVIATLPRRWQPHLRELASRFWYTTGAYFRGQLLVALFDAVFIGIGLLVLGVPLAIPLAVLVFFGGLFPIVGAFLSGGVAVLVALADSGPVIALIVLGLVLLVQQIEGNVLEPIILSSAIALHPIVVILALTAGSVLLGILGAFLAVPVAASIARGVDYLREQTVEDDDGPMEEIPAHV